MKHPVYVSNSSPIIAFERLGQMELLQRLTTSLLVPSAVRAEAFGSAPLPDWISERVITQPLSAIVLSGRLGKGESEAIALAVEMGDCYLLLDDLPTAAFGGSAEHSGDRYTGATCSGKAQQFDR